MYLVWLGVSVLVKKRMMIVSRCLVFVGLLCYTVGIDEVAELEVAVGELGSEDGKFWKDFFGKLTTHQVSLEEFDQGIGPIAQATKLAYTGEVEEPVEGFELVASQVPEIGMNALAYRRGDQLLIAFRGTTTESDRCADDILFEPNMMLPENCQKFDRDTIDYYRRAVEFTEQVISSSSHNGKAQDIVFTGHSLGCTLAQVMTIRFADQDSRSICFAAGGIKEILEFHHLDASFASRTLCIDNPWDPVVSLTKHLQEGWACLFQDVREPLPCKLCKGDLAELNKNIFCELCFAKAHVYKNYLDILNDLKSVPNCTQQLLK